MFRKIILSTLLFVNTSGAQNIKISQLPLGTGSAVGSADSFPYVDAGSGVTKRLTIYDLINVPAFTSTYAPLANPSFTGVVNAPSFVGAFTGALTGNASTATALAANPTDCGANNFAQSITANGNLGCAAVALNTADVSGTLTVNKGGTGQTTVAAAFQALSPMTTKGDLISFASAPLRVGVGTDGQVLTADSGEASGLAWTSAGSGSVTSVALALPTEFSVSGSPVTTTGTLTGAWANQTANKVFAGPASGGAATPAFRSLVAADIPAISLTTGVTGTLPIANGGTGATAFADTVIPYSNGTILTSDATKLAFDAATRTLYMGADAAGNTGGIILDPSVAQNIIVGQQSTGISGQSLFVKSGYSGTGTNLNGGTISFTAGKATGSGSSAIVFLTAAAGASGSSPRLPAQKMSLNGAGTLQLNSYSTGLLHSDGSGILTSSAVALGGADVTGTLPVTHGGTGATSFTDGSVLFSDGTNIVQDNAQFYFDSGSGNLGLQTDTPIYALTFGGENNQTIGMRRYADDLLTNGQNLEILAGGSPSGSTDISGGTLELSGGTATGAGSSSISFLTATGGSSGTTDRSPTSKMTLDGIGNLGIGAAAPSNFKVYAERNYNGGTVYGAVNTDAGTGVFSGLSAFAGTVPAHGLFGVFGDGNGDADLAGYATIYAQSSTSGINLYAVGADPINLTTNSTKRLTVDANGNIAPQGAALGTSATDGFLYAKSTAGTPAGTPTSITGASPITIDTSNDKMYFYSGGAWVEAGSGGGGGGTVTSVDVSVPSASILGSTGGPVTSSGTIALTTTGTSGGIPYFSSSSKLSTSAALTANALILGGGAGATPASLGSLGTTSTVLHGNAAGAPTFGAVSLTADVSGTLPIANGGTNSTATPTAGGIGYGTGTAHAYTAADTAGRAVVSGGASAPTFFSPTAGSVVFAGTSGILAQDNAGLFYDDSNDRLGVGSPATANTTVFHGSTYGNTLKVHVSGTQDFMQTVIHKSSDLAGFGPYLGAVRSRTTEASPSIVQSGDTLFRFDAMGFDGTDYESAANITVFSDGTPGSDDMPGRISFSTTPDGSFASTERLRITNAGNIAPIGSALSTSATDGFQYLKATAGTPAGTPTSITGASPVTIDTSNNKAYFYSGGAWKELCTAGTSYYVDATFNGGNYDLGVANVASYTEMTNSGMTLTPTAGSSAVGVMCAGTNAATSPSTSPTTCAAGDESNGINFTIPAAGTYEVCAYFAHGASADSGESVTSIFELIETPTNAQTLTQEGNSRMSSQVSAMTIATGADQGAHHPVTNCSNMTFAAAGTKGIRLMYEQNVVGSPDASVVLSDNNASNGQRNIHWTVKPLTTVCGSGGGGGSVTSVDVSVPATSILGVSGGPVTSSGTIALTTTGTSGGIPYFSSTSQLATSAALTANKVVIGGGAGVAPSVYTPTAGSILFAGTAGIIQQDNASLFYDDSTDRLILGNNASGGNLGAKLQVQGTTTATAGAELVGFSATANVSPSATFSRSKNASLAGNTIVASGDRIASFNFLGANGTTFTDAAQILVEIDGTPGASSDMPGRIKFLTTPDGSGTPTERMRITANGRVGIGTNALAADTTLEVDGSITNDVATDNTAATTIDFSTSNLQFTSATCTSMTLNGMKNGGTYQLWMSSTTTGTCSFTASGLTIKLPAGHGATTSGKSTLYGFTVFGSTVITTWAPGYP